MGGKRILIIDDDPDQLTTLAALLRAGGHRVECATSPLYALTLARDFRPEFAFVDIAMPVMDGYETARRLRSQFGTPHVIAISGRAGPEAEARSLSAGFEAHLAKPLAIAVIERMLAT